jgi:Domain of unknown function (DUF6438)
MVPLVRSLCFVAAALPAAFAMPNSAGPSTQHPKLAIETITISVGPCFGFCPVYKVDVRRNGVLRFVGARHTAVLGEKTLRTRGSSFRGLLRDLSPYRPADGSEVAIECIADVSDTSRYSITWTDAAGRKTVATVQSSCPGGPGQALGKLIAGVPSRLGITQWTKQTTRPDTPRG